jgi:hypothetical protein
VLIDREDGKQNNDKASLQHRNRSRTHTHWQENNDNNNNNNNKIVIIFSKKNCLKDP